MATLFEKTSSGYKAILPTTLAERVVTDEEHLFVTQEEKDRWDEGGGSGGVPVYYDTLIMGKETLTNQWRDGKPVYQMLINLGLSPQGTTVGVLVSATHSIDIINVHECFIDSAWVTNPNHKTRIPLTWVRGVNSTTQAPPTMGINVLDIKDTSIDLHIQNSVGALFNDHDVWCIIRYTKTTDVVIPPYQLPVPCWDIEEYGVEYRTMKLRNGKPVYKKLIDCGTAPATETNGVSAIKDVSHGIPDLEELVSINAIGQFGDQILPMNSQVSDIAVNINPDNYKPRRFTCNILRSQNVIRIYNAYTSWNSIAVTVLLEYTKTIDTPETSGLMPAIVQEPGNRTDVTMSQKAITDMALWTPITKTVNIKDLQAEINALPKLLMADVTFNVNPGTMTERRVVIENFTGIGVLTLSGNSTLANTHTLLNILIHRCTNSKINVVGFNMSTLDNTAMYCAESSCIANFSFMRAVAGDKSTNANRGIVSVGSPSVWVTSCEISNKYSALTPRQGNMYVQDVSGVGNGSKFWPTVGGVIYQLSATNTIVGTVLTTGGGLVVNPSGGTVGT